MTIDTVRNEQNKNIELLERRMVERERDCRRTYEEELHFDASKGKTKLEDGYETSALETEKTL